MSNEAESCPDRSDRADSLYERVEVVLSYMFCEFAKRARANRGPTDIHWAAVQFARDGIRKPIYDWLNHDATRTPDDFISGPYVSDPDGTGPLKSLREYWLSTADQCSRASGNLRVDTISRVWQGPYASAPARPTPLKQHAAETIGSQMWFRFGVGVERIRTRQKTPRGELMIPIDVIKKGRAQSGGRVHTNSKRCVKGNRIDFSEWDWEGVTVCAFQAGRLAAKISYDANRTKMEREDFWKAWCKVWETMREERFLLEQDGVESADQLLLSSAC